MVYSHLRADGINLCNQISNLPTAYIVVVSQVNTKCGELNMKGGLQHAT